MRKKKPLAMWQYEFGIRRESILKTRIRSFGSSRILTRRGKHRLPTSISLSKIEALGSYPSGKKNFLQLRRSKSRNILISRFE